jgi:hypothetical protein
MMPDDAELREEYEPDPYEDGYTESFEEDNNEHETTS